MRIIDIKATYSCSQFVYVNMKLIEMGGGGRIHIIIQLGGRGGREGELHMYSVYNMLRGGGGHTMHKYAYKHIVHRRWEGATVKLEK